MPRNVIAKASFIDSIQEELGEIDDVFIKRKDSVQALFQRLKDFKNDTDTPQNYKNVIQTSINDAKLLFQAMLDNII